MNRFLKHLILDGFLWLGMFLMVTENPYTPYAYNAIAFVYGAKALLAFLTLLVFNQIKVTQIPSKAYAAYVDTTVLIETLVLATFGFYWIAAASVFTWAIFGSLVRNKGKEQNAPQR